MARNAAAAADQGNVFAHQRGLAALRQPRQRRQPGGSALPSDSVTPWGTTTRPLRRSPWEEQPGEILAGGLLQICLQTVEGGGDGRRRGRQGIRHRRDRRDGGTMTDYPSEFGGVK